MIFFEISSEFEASSPPSAQNIEDCFESSIEDKKSKHYMPSWTENTV